MIQESKYLGGDMEHTHLVKGLDFALLQKVRATVPYMGAAGVPGDQLLYTGSSCSLPCYSCFLP